MMLSSHFACAPKLLAPRAGNDIVSAMPGGVTLPLPSGGDGWFTHKNGFGSRRGSLGSRSRRFGNASRSLGIQYGSKFGHLRPPVAVDEFRLKENQAILRVCEQFF
jgi:hypothetical protein